MRRFPCCGKSDWPKHCYKGPVLRLLGETSFVLGHHCFFKCIMAAVFSMGQALILLIQDGTWTVHTGCAIPDPA